jgi:hypothetical protein
MAVLSLGLLLVAAQVPAASGWRGPGLLCGATFSIQLQIGETALPVSGGIHQRSLVLRTASGDLSVEEFESRIARADPGPGLNLASGFVAYRADDGARHSYRLLEGRGVRVILSGVALAGSDRDRAALERFFRRPDDARLCTYSFGYG